MRKLAVLCALLTACTPFAVAAPAADTRGPIGPAVPATYYPTVTPFPTFTPPPRPTQTPTAAATATVPPTAAPTMASTEAPLPTSTAVVIAAAPTPAPVEPTPVPPPTAIPLPLVTATPEAAAMAAANALAFAAAPAAPAASCPAVASGYELVPIEGPVYKNNALTDENADLRLSIIGLAPTGAPLALVDYNGPTDPDAPKLHGLFEPNRVPSFTATHLRYNWSWSSDAPPYGARGGLNSDWPVAAVDMLAAPGEAIHPPERGPVIWGGGQVALVIYAGEREVTLAYTRHDGVEIGYVVHMLNLCVDPGLVAQYRAQLADGRRATGLLPGVRANQPLGTALGAVTVAIRDRGAFLDPRSRKDWW